MRKIILNLLFILVAQWAMAQTITITSPNGGEVWAGCTSKNITWTASGTSNFYSIDYSTDGGTNWTSVTSFYSTTSGSYSWTVPNINSSNCLVRITDSNTPTIVDQSNSAFTITAPLILTSPNGGEKWEAGKVKSITWAATGTSNRYKIEYSTNGGSNWNTITSNVYNTTGIYNWTVVNSPTSSGLIRVTDYSTACMTDKSDNLFTIDPPKPTLTLTYPNSNVTLYTGKAYNIRWSSSNLGSNLIALDYSTDSGKTWTPIVTGISNSGSHSWTVPSTPSNACLVKVKAVGTTYKDSSNTYFKIKSPFINVFAPNGNENWQGCKTYPIQWTHNGTVNSRFNIKYSINNGATWTSIANNVYQSSTTNSNYNWTVPNNISGNAKIRIEDASNILTYDESDTTFLLSPNNDIIVTSPNGGEKWEAGTNRTITWVDNVSSVHVYYSSNGGGSYTRLTNSYGTSGNSLNWSVPNAPGSSYKIKVQDRYSTCKFDESDSNFTVDPPTPRITVTAPSNGTYYPYQSLNIRWTSAYLTSSFVSIDYSVDSGSTWNSVTAVTNNDGAHSWSIPNSISSNCYVRVSEYNNPNVSDKNNSVFKIIPPHITLTSPNGGESWKGCETKTITWTVGGGSNNYRLEYSLDTGNTWKYITARSGTSYNWKIPANLSSSAAKIRVKDQSRNIEDESDGTFIFTPNTDVIVTTPNGGEHWEAGKTKTIQWVDNLSSLHVYYSQNNGTNWNRLTNSYGTSGNSLSWSVVNAPGSNYLIKVQDRYDACKFDVSDTTFTVDPPQPVITVTSPNGGTYYPLQSHTIRWSSAYLTSSFVNIEFSSDSGATWTNVATNTNNDGAHPWVFPNVTSNNCYIRITEVGNPTVNDLGAKFKLIPAFLTLTAPNGGEVWKGCETKTISWTVGGGSNSYRLEYSLDSGATWQYITNRSGTSYSWKIPAALSSAVTKIRVKDNGRTIEDESDNVFTTIPNTDVVVVSPNGGEKWEAGKTRSIQWVDNVSTTHVYYSQNNGANWSRLTNSYGTSGNSLSWNVPNNPGNNYLIKVQDRSDACKFDVSDSVFTVTPPVPTITVTTPNGGSYYPLSNINIRWSSSYLTSPFVSIEFSSDSMATWTTITSVTNNDGSHSWTFPNVISNNCYVRVNEYGSTGVTDISNRFSLIPAHITLNTPNGGEIWKGCETKTISWTVGGGSGSYRLEYSVDSGKTWTYLTNRSSTSYSWKLPANLSSTGARIRVRDLSRNLSDESDNVLSFIPNTSIIVTAPNGGESWEATTTKTISWVDNVSTLHVYYSSNNGASWSRLTNSYGTSGNSLSWNVPNNPGSNYRIKVEDRNNTCQNDISDSVFTVTPPSPRITVTSPNGGTYYPKQSVNIRWTSAYLNSSFVNIEFSSDNAATWTNIVSSTSNDGSHLWTIPDSISTQCYVRVSESGSPTVYDLGNRFTIRAPYLTLTEPLGGQVWKGCENRYIRWTKGGASSSIRLEYSLDSGITWSTITNSSSSNYNWQLPGNLSTSNGLIRVRDISNNLTSTSVSPLTFIPNQDIILSTPNGGEKWEAGKTRTISWVDNNISSVHVYYSSNKGSNWTRLTGYYGTSSNSLNWSVPNNPGKDYLVRVQDRSNTCKTDNSDTTFEVTPPVPTLTVTYPNSNVGIYQGQSVNVRWSSSYLTSPYVRIDYSLDSGLTWNVVSNVTNNDGSHNWIAPNVNTTKALIRVSEYGNAALYDISNTTFTIQPSIVLTAPNGNNGQVDYRGCTVTSIKWNAGGTSRYYRLEYSLNGGTSWTVINSSYYSTSSSPIYNWTMPNTASKRVLVRVRDRNNLSKSDQSDNEFEITAPITLNTPNMGGTYYVGDKMNIDWNSNGTSNYYNIDYSTNGGATWTSIAFNYNTSGSSYQWTIPGTVSNNCLVRVTDNINSCKKTQSVVAFKIVSGSKKLVLTNPVGGESWAGCSNQLISWTNSATSASYKIEYSSDAGQSWSVIQSAYASPSKTYNWKVPSQAGANYIVRVSDATDADVTDQSDSSFEVTNASAPIVSAIGATTICNGSSVQLTCDKSSDITWYPGGMKTQSVTVTTPGSYYVVESTGSGCSIQSNTVVVSAGTPPAAPTVTASGATKFCLGGSVILSTNQTTGITWYPGGQTSQTITATQGGSYTVTYTDISGCSSTSTPLVITTNSIPTITRSNSGACLGDTLTLTSSSLTGNVWFPSGDTTRTIKVVSDGNFTVQATDKDNCVSTSVADTVLFTPPPAKPVISLSGSASFCNGESVVLTASPKNNITWSTGAQDSSITVDSAATITATYTNPGGCKSVSLPVNTSILPAPVKPTVSLIGDSVFCSGDSVVLASSGTNNVWNTAETTGSIVAKSTGYYSTTVTGSNGCKTASDPILITVNPIPSTPLITANGSTTFCSGDSVILSSNQPSGNLWSTGDSSSSITVKSGGSYIVEYENQFGCSRKSLPVDVLVNSAPVKPVITSSKSLNICSGDSVLLTSSFGGKALWSNGDTNRTIVVSGTGYYSVKAIGNNACEQVSDVASVIVNPLPQVPVLTVSDTGVLCSGDSVNLTSNSALAHSWSTGDTTNSIVVQSTGNYSVRVKDGNGCESAVVAKALVFNNKPSTPIVSVTGDTAVCSGDTVLLTSSAIANNQWSNGLTTRTIKVTQSGNYSVDVTSNSCVSSSRLIPITVHNKPVKPLLSLTGDSTFCNGDSAVLSTNYSNGIRWSNGDTTNNIVVKTSGVYSVEYTDANGCSASSPIQPISVYALPSKPTISISGNTTFCEGGDVTLTSSALNHNNWSNGDTTNSVVIDKSGNYYVEVDNAYGCTNKSSTIAVTVNAIPAKPLVSITGDTTFCNGDSVKLNVNYPNGVVWSNGDTSSQITVKTSNVLSVNYSDVNGCSSTSKNVIVTVNPMPAVPVVSALGSTEFCAGGSVTLNSSSSVDNKWSNGDTSSSIIVANGGNYSVSVTNAFGCSATSINTLVKVNAIPQSPVITAIGDTSFCQGDSVTLTSSYVSGNTWSNGDTNQQVVLKSNNLLSVSFTDANGCSASSKNITVTAHPLPTVPTITASGPTTFCDGGNVVLTSSSPVANKWSTGDTTTAITVKSGGNVDVSVENTFGCSVRSILVPITVNPLPAKPLIALVGDTTFCLGDSVRLNANYTTGLSWSNGDTNTSIVAKSSTTLNVKHTDANGCSSTSKNVTITANPVPVVPVVSASGATTFCDGGSVTLNSSSATNNVWSTNDSTASVLVRTSGNYGVSTYNQFGCMSQSVNILVQVNPLPAKPSINASGATTFCQGDSVILSSSSLIGNRWSTTDTTNNITIKSTGVYNLKVRDANGCESPIAVQNVLVNPIPTAPVISANGPIGFCQGDSVTLTSNALQGNIWSQGDTVQSIVVKNSGSYHVKLVSAAGCNALSNVINVSVGKLPVLPVISLIGDSAFCTGDSTTLVSSSAIGNRWSTGDTTQSIIVKKPGSITLKVLDNGCYSNVSAKMLRVFANPKAPLVSAVGDTAFCPGDSVVLASSYATGNTWVPTGTKGAQLAVKSSGFYSVSYTDTNGCSAISNTIQTILHPAPQKPFVSPGGTVDICEGDEIVLRSDEAQGIEWNANQSPVDTIVVTTAGDYFVNYTDGNGCKTTSNTVKVTVLPLPAPATITQVGVDLVASTAPQYQWYLAGTLLAGEIGSQHRPLQNGVYQVQTFDANGCKVLSAPYNFNSVGMEDYLTPLVEGLKLYPNPSDGQLSMDLQLGSLTDVTIEILSIDGKRVYTEYIIPVQTAINRKLDLTFLNSGVYQFNILGKNTSYSERITIQH